LGALGTTGLGEGVGNGLGVAPVDAQALARAAARRIGTTRMEPAGLSARPGNGASRTT